MKKEKKKGIDFDAMMRERAARGHWVHRILKSISLTQDAALTNLEKFRFLVKLLIFHSCIFIFCVFLTKIAIANPSVSFLSVTFWTYFTILYIVWITETDMEPGTKQMMNYLQRSLEIICAGIILFYFVGDVKGINAFFGANPITR